MSSNKLIPLSLGLLALAGIAIWSGLTPTPSGPSPIAEKDERNQATASAGDRETDLSPSFRSPARGESQGPFRMSPEATGARIPLTREMVRHLADGPDATRIPLPRGREAEGTVERRTYDENGGLVSVEGEVTAPASGRFLFLIPPPEEEASGVFGIVVLPGEETSYRSGMDRGGELIELPTDHVICRDLTRDMSPPPTAAAPANPAPRTAAHEVGVKPLQSRPGAAAVIYLDFDGHTGYLTVWGSITALPAPFTNEDVEEIWKQVAEDFAPFEMNVTTDLAVYNAASKTSRQRCIITPTTTPKPGTGGASILGSFKLSAELPCWVFTLGSRKSCAEVISHEIGHTLGLDHDGRANSAYFSGHGTGDTSWGPIMGASASRHLTQWSKGEYSDATNKEDDLAIIAKLARYRKDDAGSTAATAGGFQYASAITGEISLKGIIETTKDTDLYRFTIYRGGPCVFRATPASPGPNLDVFLSLHSANGTTILAFDNPADRLDAEIRTTLAAGTYFIGVTGTGKGSASTDGYSDYGSLGQYQVTGMLPPTAFSIPPADLTINRAAATDGLKLHQFQLHLAGVPTPVEQVTWTMTNAGDILALDPKTGVVTVRNATTARRYPYDASNLTVTATIKGLDPFRGVVTLRLQGPAMTSFTVPPASFTINRATVKDGQIFHRFQVVSGGIPSPNEQVTWSMVMMNDVFNLDPKTGVLSIRNAKAAMNYWQGPTYQPVTATFKDLKPVQGGLTVYLE